MLACARKDANDEKRGQQRVLYAKSSGHLTVTSSTQHEVIKQYGVVFSPAVIDPGATPLVNLEESTPEGFYDDLETYLNDPRSKNALHWSQHFKRTNSQRAALNALTDFMPASKVRQCLNVTDGSNVDDLVDPTYQGYYNRRNIKAFFRYEPEFAYKRVDGEIKPRKLEMPKLQMPDDMPITEAEHERPSVPLGWRIFAVLGLYHTAKGVSDPSVLWSGFPLTDGNPMGRLASGLYNSPLGLRVASGMDAVKPDNTLLHSRHPIEQGELFRGRKGDMSEIYPDGIRQHERISKDVYKYRFSEDGVWPRKHFESVLSSMTISQALWARLSTTMLRSTGKIHRLYKLRVRKNFKQEVFKARRRNSIVDNSDSVSDVPVETSVGILYFLSAPTLHHAVDLVCSDPMARCNFYEQLLLFEADDALKYRIFENREPDKDSPYQYMVLGNYDDIDDHTLLDDKMMRFLVRSNCVNTHVRLHAPRKDSMVDLGMPLQQFLPLTTEQRDRLLDRLDSIRDACNTVNGSSPIGDLSIINQFDTDDALDWARRCPYTRAGCYKSLFVAKAYEIGFYGRNCDYIAPLPMPKSMVPLRQEYAVVDRDPVNILKTRMSNGEGHYIALPKVIPRDSFLYHELSSENGLGMAQSAANVKPDHPVVSSPDSTDLKNDSSWPNRLYITIRRTVADSYKSCNISSRYVSTIRHQLPKQVHLGPVPFTRDGRLAVDVDSCHLRSPKSRRLRSVSRDEVLYVSDIDSSNYRKGYAQMLGNVLLSRCAIHKLLNEDAPTELDMPFYADILKDYIYISLPPGDFFENLPAHDNKRFNAMSEENETVSPTTAEDMNMLPENRPRAYAGFWMRKSDCYLLYKDDRERSLLLGIPPSRLSHRRELGPDMIMRALIRNEIVLDYVRKGAALSWPDLSNAYSTRGERIVSHLTPTEAMKTMWTVPPLNTPNKRYTRECEIPAGRFYEKGIEYPEGDPRNLMSNHPREVYKMTLEHLQKVDRGEARPEDDPVKLLVEADYIPPPQGKVILTTWEEPDVNLYNLRKSDKKKETTHGN
eukprot:XP_001611698.1 hypothetical protein [Babesia bovis T2Bo]